jgi:hypothetical protein
VVALALGCPVREARQAPEPACERRAILYRALQPFLAERNVEAGFPESVAERSEDVPVEGLGRHRRAPALEISARGRAAELLAQHPELREELLSGRKSTRAQSRQTLGGVPGSEAVDDRLGMDPSAPVALELAHRRGAAQAGRRAFQLGEDLVVRIAAAHPRLECSQVGGIDLHSGLGLRIEQISPSASGD